MFVAQRNREQVNNNESSEKLDDLHKKQEVLNVLHREQEQIFKEAERKRQAYDALQKEQAKRIKRLYLCLALLLIC